MSTTSCPEELDELVKQICQKNTAALDEEMAALKTSIFELKGKIIYLIKVFSTDNRERKPSPVDTWSIPDPCADMVRQSGSTYGSTKKKKSYRLKMALCDRGTSPKPSYTEPCTPGRTCQDREMFGDRLRYCHCDGFMGQDPPRKTFCSIKTLFCGSERTATCSENCRPPQPYTDDRIPTCKTGSNTGDCCRCTGAVGQVKIWFQNRRMKWKRSKKAQQEAKCAKEGEKCHSPSSQSHGHQKICTQEPCTSTQTHSEHSSRKTSVESEQLYRPYVV